MCSKPSKFFARESLESMRGKRVPIERPSDRVHKVRYIREAVLFRINGSLDDNESTSSDARGLDLGRHSSCNAAVFGDHDPDVETSDHAKVLLDGERSAARDDILFVDPGLAARLEGVRIRQD